MNARNQNNFNDSMALGDKAEKELMTILRQSITGFISIDKVDWTKFGFDLAVTYQRKNIQFTKAVEVKDLAGGYATGVIEQWADDAKTKRPHWWKMGGCDLIFFKDESRNLWFVYDAREVISYLENYTGRLSRARNGNKDDSGWLAFFYWDPNNLPPDHNPQFVMPGWKATFKGAK